MIVRFCVVRCAKSQCVCLWCASVGSPHIVICLFNVASPPTDRSVNVHMPKDRVTQSHQGYGFVEFLGEEDADYAIKIMNMIKLYGKPIRVNKVSRPAMSS